MESFQMRSGSLLFFTIWIFCTCGVLFSMDNVYVLNTLSQNLSVVNPATGDVTPDAAALGLYTNDIKIRNNRIYVANSGINEIQVIDINSLQTVNSFDTGTGTNPYLMEFINDSTIAVTLLFTNEVAFINLESGEITKIQTGSGPTGLKYTDGLLYVCNTNFITFGEYGPGTIDVIDPSTLTHVDTITVGTNPNLIDVNSGEDFFVLSTGNYADIPSKIFRLDKFSHEVTDSISIQGDPSLSNMFIDQLNRMFLTLSSSDEYGNIIVYDLDKSEFIKDGSDPLLGGPGIAVDRDGKVYAADFGTDSLFVYDTNLNRTNSYLVGDGPLALALHPDLQTAVEYRKDQNALVKDFRLLNNYPNPFNGSTTIQYELNHATHVNLSIYSLNGQKISSIIDANQSAGKYSLQWPGNKAAISTATGTYILRLQTEYGAATKKLNYIK
jgi:DNA-binding beta-propeller fold protein YncE